MESVIPLGERDPHGHADAHLPPASLLAKGLLDHAVPETLELEGEPIELRVQRPRCYTPGGPPRREGLDVIVADTDGRNGFEVGAVTDGRRVEEPTTCSGVFGAAEDHETAYIATCGEIIAAEVGRWSPVY